MILLTHRIIRSAQTEADDAAVSSVRARRADGLSKLSPRRVWAHVLLLLLLLRAGKHVPGRREAVRDTVPPGRERRVVVGRALRVLRGRQGSDGRAHPAVRLGLRSEVGNCGRNLVAFAESSDVDLLEQVDVELEQDVPGDLVLCEEGDQEEERSAPLFRV